MRDSSIDIYDVRFWLVFASAVVVLNILKGGTVRRWAFALINIGFLGFFLKPPVAPVIAVGVAGIVAGVVLVWAFLKSGPGRMGALPVAIGGTTLVSLFIYFKTFHASSTGGARLFAVLTTIGFSYVALRIVDVSRAVSEGRHRAPDLASLINYLLPFHMIAAGPIQSYDDFAAQPPVPPASNIEESLAAVESIAAGLFKKFILAAFIEKMFLTGFRAHGWYFFLEAQLNYLWLYLDFSAYSDIALGLGAMMGVATPKNFDRPYLARNLVDFWERWHISLSQFIRRNLFIPIQLWLMRRSGGLHPLRAASLAFLASFLLCGLWHSISVAYLAWGAMHATGLIVCNSYKAYLVKKFGRRGLNRYLENRWIRAAATVATFEFVAATTVVATYPFKELLWWDA